MWPAEDVDRIRGEIVRAREHGIHSQLDGVSSSHRHRKRPAPIYEQKEVTPAQAILMRIYPPAEMIDMTLGKREVHVMLVVDSAGKVQAVTMLGVTEKVEGLVVDSDSKMQGIKPLSEKQKIEQIVQTSVARWKFVPAFKSGRAVTSRMQTAVWLQR